MRPSGDIAGRIALGALIVGLFSSRAMALTDVGLPIHPNAIESSIDRQSGKGEGTEWVSVTFKTRAPYAQVVKFYREKTGRHVQISQIDSGKLQNTMILFAKRPQDQITINISSEVGQKVTVVEISRNLVGP
jgi:hypothetical protein